MVIRSFLTDERLYLSVVLIALLVGYLVLSCVVEDGTPTPATTPVAGTPPAHVVPQEDSISEATQARWLEWMSDERVPVFWFWRQRDHGRCWVAVCHIVPRVWSSRYKAFNEDAVSLERALIKVLDKMDADHELRSQSR